MFNETEQRVNLNADGLLSEARDHLREFGLTSRLDCQRSDDPTVDAVIHVSGRSGMARTFGVRLKKRLTQELATAIHQAPDLPLLLIAPSISDQVGERLRARGIDYVDAAGNAHLAWDDVLIDVRGRRKRTERIPKPSPRGARAFSRTGLKLCFVLLTWPESAAQPLRQLAHASGVSLGTAKTVIDDLTSAGYLYQGSSGRRLTRGGDFLNRWSEAYSVALAPALSLADFSSNDLSWWMTSEAEFLATGVQVSGEAGGSILDPYLRPSTLTLYADELPLALIRRHRLVRASDAGNVNLRQRFWQSPESPSWLAPSTLIYADLLASGDPRQREHADRIRTTDDRLTRLDRA